MKQTEQTLRVAVAQASPVILDMEKTIEKAISIIKKAGEEKVDLVVFPKRIDNATSARTHVVRLVFQFIIAM